jgi:hypothetical protein
VEGFLMTRHLTPRWALWGASALLAASAAVGAGAAPALALAGMPASGGAGAYPLHTGSLRAESPVSGLRPGASLQVAGSGFLPGSTVQLSVRSQPISLGSAKTDATGSFTTTVVLPSSLEAGSHTVYATGPDPQGGTLVESLGITVGGTGRLLAHTGQDAAAAGSTGALGSMGVPLAAGLVVVAGSAVFLTRARRRKHG